MAKITITLEASKMKGTAKERTYKNREGVEVSVKEIKLEVVPVKEPKTVFSADKYDLVKTHFVALPQTAEERAQQTPSVFVGEGITTVWKNDTPAVTEAKVIEEEDEYF